MRGGRSRTGAARSLPPSRAAPTGADAVPGHGGDGPRGRVAGPWGLGAKRAVRGALCGWARPLVAALLVFMAMCAATAPVVIYQVHEFRAISPVDEITYVDYLDRVDHGQPFVREGQVDNAFTDHVFQCRGVGSSVHPVTFVDKPNPANCAGAPHTPFGFRDSADIDPPAYYAITDVGVRVLRGFGVTHDLVDAGRYMGIFWGGLGLSLLFLLARLLGARRLPSAIICLAALGTSGLWMNWTHITPHATDIAVGASVAIVAVLFVRRRASAWTLLLAGFIPVLFKASDIMIVAAVSLFFLVAALLGRLDRGLAAADELQPFAAGTDGAAVAGTPSRVADDADTGEIPVVATPAPAAGRSHLATSAETRLLVGALLTIAGLAAASVGWLLVRHHYALTTTPSNRQFEVSSFHLKYLLNEVGDFIQPLQTSVGTVLSFWALGSVVRFATGNGESVERRALAVSVLPIAIFGAWSFVLSNYVLLHQYNPIPARYGLTLFPVILAFGALNLRSRWAQLVGVLIVALLAYQTFNPVG